MLWFRSLFILLTAGFIFCGRDPKDQTVDLAKERSKIYVRGFFCKASEKYFHKNVSCFAKSYNRSFSGINGYVMTKFPLKNITVRKSKRLRSRDLIWQLASCTGLCPTNTAISTEKCCTHPVFKFVNCWTQCRATILSSSSLLKVPTPSLPSMRIWPIKNVLLQ